jgi:hypothetical protein
MQQEKEIFPNQIKLMFQQLFNCVWGVCIYANKHQMRPILEVGGKTKS